MNVQEAIDRKKALEEDIRLLLKTYNTETGLIIDAVSVYKITLGYNTQDESDDTTDYKVVVTVKL